MMCSTTGSPNSPSSSFAILWALASSWWIASVVARAGVPCGMVKKAATLSASTDGKKFILTQPPATNPPVSISIAPPSATVR